MYTKEITSLGKVTAGSFSLGNGNFIVDDSGILTAKGANITGNITSQSLITRQGMNDYISLNEVKNGVGDNLLKFRHLNGNIAAEFGVINGETAMIWYDQFGNEVWRAGETGIKYVTVTEKDAYWVDMPMYHIVGLNSFDNLSSSNDALITTEIQNVTCMRYGAEKNELAINAGTTYHSYVPAQTQGNVTPAEEAKKGVYVSENTSGARIPNGWYVRKGYFATVTDGLMTYQTTVNLHKYSNGIIINSYTTDISLSEPTEMCGF